MNTRTLALSVVTAAFLASAVPVFAGPSVAIAGNAYSGNYVALGRGPTSFWQANDPNVNGYAYEWAAAKDTNFRTYEEYAFAHSQGGNWTSPGAVDWHSAYGQTWGQSWATDGAAFSQSYGYGELYVALLQESFGYYASATSAGVIGNGNASGYTTLWYSPDWGTNWYQLEATSNYGFWDAYFLAPVGLYYLGASGYQENWVSAWGGNGYSEAGSYGQNWLAFEAVPEPATMLALGAGIAALVARRRRK